jgi:hypothetical protein
MGLKGYRLWVMGQLDSNVQSPTTREGSTKSRMELESRSMNAATP